MNIKTITENTTATDTDDLIIVNGNVDYTLQETSDVGREIRVILKSGSCFIKKNTGDGFYFLDTTNMVYTVQWHGDQWRTVGLFPGE